jgi:hypothetical protein
MPQFLQYVYDLTYIIQGALHFVFFTLKSSCSMKLQHPYFSGVYMFYSENVQELGLVLGSGERVGKHLHC